MRRATGGTGGSGEPDLRHAYHRRNRDLTRETALVAGIVALIAFPAWGAFDLLLLPGRAQQFIAVRLAFEIPILLAWVGLRWNRTGARWPEPFAFAILALPEIAIAWMIPRAEPRLEAYLLGFSLAIYASAFLMVWRWQLTAGLVALTYVMTGVFVLTAPSRLSPAQVATVAFYLVTAGAIAMAGQAYRYVAGWRQYETQATLEEAQHRNETLLAQLARLSREDDLSQVANRRAWDEWLAAEFRRAERSGEPLSIMLCDFDHLKAVNDEHGHQAGDDVLRFGASLLAQRVRNTDFVARIGGDEFAIGCPATTAASARMLAAELLRMARETRWPAASDVTFSIGIAQIRSSDENPGAAVERADGALYRAKRTRDAVAVAGAGRPKPPSESPLHNSVVQA